MWTRTFLMAAMLSAGMARAQDAAPGPVFISPMGEPFRGNAGGSPQDRWFAQADLDHDGKLSMAEMRRDAARFFATLDRNHDGEIDPDEIERYETEVAPEIAALMSRSGTYNPTKSDDAEAAPMGADGFPADQPGGTGGPRQHRHRRGSGGDRVATSYLGLREPVRAADTNLNRGVSLAEFDAAAQQRLHQLDTANRGYLTPDGLKPLLR